jgi:hypothetical protein
MRWALPSRSLGGAAGGRRGLGQRTWSMADANDSYINWQSSYYICRMHSRGGCNACPVIRDFFGVGNIPPLKTAGSREVRPSSRASGILSPRAAPPMSITPPAPPASLRFLGEVPRTVTRPLLEEAPSSVPRLHPGDRLSPFRESPRRRDLSPEIRGVCPGLRRRAGVAATGRRRPGHPPKYVPYPEKIHVSLHRVTAPP